MDRPIKFLTAAIATCEFLVVSHRASAADEPAPPAFPRVMTVTRQVAEFSETEQKLLEMAATRNGMDLAAKLTPSFEARYAFAAIQPISHDVWVAGMIDSPPQRWNFRAMSVHEHQDTVVVNFVLHVEPADRPSSANDLFVVDLWVREADAWKLDARYLSPLTEKDAQRSSIDLKNAH